MIFRILITNYLRNLYIVTSLLGTVGLLVASANASLAHHTPRFDGINRVGKGAAKFVPNNRLQVTNETNALATQLIADPTLSINDVTANEGDDPITLNAATFTVSLSAPSQQTVSVVVSTQAGSAIGDVDFGAGSISITIAPGKMSQTVTVFVKGDSAVEGTEQFFLNLSSPVNATIADGQGVCTIVDDDSLILLTEENVQRAIALDSVLFTRDSFPIANNLNFSSDQRTRVIVFAIGLKLLAGENASAVSATAEDSLGTVRPLEVEFVGKVPTYDWLTQVVLKLNDQITTSGDVKIKITLHGATSNTVLVGMRPQ
jgi:Calx-beta domain